MEQKAIDGQENPITVINANKFYEVQKFVALTNHQYNPQSVIMSKKFWDSLSAAEKTIVQDAAMESAKVERAAARGQVAGALANMKSNGMSVTELPAAEMAILRDKMKPVIAKHGESIAATVAELQVELAKLRK
jgi:TRAP-type C4-dicarboxylate transport system substrate-binding protein